ERAQPFQVCSAQACAGRSFLEFSPLKV
ncbi:uncharacterized protein METZ01_LOCUS440042, partial [marine metagenome]